MIDINYIRENPEKVKKGIAARQMDPKIVDDVLELDKKWRGILQIVEELRRERNEVARKREDEAVGRGQQIKSELKKLDKELTQITNKYEDALNNIPNLPASDVPAGPEENKKLQRKVGKPKKFSFTPKDHLELGLELGIIDIERASKISGSRFAYLVGDGVLLELALINFAMEKLIKKGFTPVFPPMLIKKEITKGLGYWNGGGNENYYFVRDFEKISESKERELDLYLVGTGEHSTVPMHADEVLGSGDLPKKYVTFSSCFRREAGSYGKDTKGILRVHQFDKVEMVEFVRPEDDKKEHEAMLSYAEELMQDLGLPYQIVILAAGDTGFPTAKTYDIETWLPGQDKYRETHSVSTTTDYQARNLNIKYRSKDGDGFVHILNGTAFAIGRTIIAILENYQQKDGSVLVPKVLQKWMGKDKIVAPK